MPSATVTELPDTLRVAGSLDSIKGQVVEGWAYSLNEPAKKLVVEVCSGTRVIGEVKAGLFREDLLKAGIGDGSHAFSFRIPDRLLDGRTHEISARAKGCIAALDGSPQRAELRREPEGAGPPSIRGHLDPIEGRLVVGWAYDDNNPDAPVVVEILDGDQNLGEVVANQPRDDLARQGIGSGEHGFEFILPPELSDGRGHRISARLKRSETRIDGSPRVFRTGGTEIGKTPERWSHEPVPPSPHSDPQLVMLSALQAMSDALRAHSEALSAQTRALNRLLERLPAPAAEPSLATVVSQVREPDCGPLFKAAIDHQRGTRDFVVFSVIDWHFRIQRPQHIARHLAAAGDRVFYLSVHFQHPGASYTRFQVVSQPAPGVFQVVLCCKEPVPNLYSGIGESWQVHELRAALLDAVERLDLKSIVAIIQFPAWYPIVAALPGATIMYDCLDHVVGFDNVSPHVVEQEELLIRHADAVVVTSEFLAKHVAQYRNFSLIPNGAEVEYFSECPLNVWQSRGSPVIGYYGAISSWFDTALIAACAEMHPEWDFVLIGSTDGCDTTALKALPNIFLLGEKPYPTLTRYLYAFDVCVIPFKLIDLIKATNPVKVYEYLCSGKPVVATDVPELRRLPPGLVYLAKNAREFERNLQKAMLEKDDRRRDKRKAWARQHSWDSRVTEFRATLAQKSPSVSVVVLCYNQRTFTSACLSSIWQHSEYPNLEIICVDNASSDDTLQYLRAEEARHGNFKLIANERNLGYAGGNNMGLRAATGDVCILLNNDTYVTKGWVRDLIRPLLQDSQLGLVGPLTNMAGNEQKLAINYSNMEEMQSKSQAFTIPRRHQLYEVENLAFFCVAMRRDTIDKVGFLSEEYGRGYFEDDDYCAAIRGAGYKIAICDDVFVHHHHSASFSTLSTAERTELMSRNQQIFEAKWGPWKAHRYRNEPGFGE